MNEIKILELSLRNFKGIKDLKLIPGGNNLNIYGDNATGKTTIMDAFLWLLFDKDSANSSNFNIKTLDKSGHPIHMLEHEVIAKLEIDKKTVELQKIYTEKWTKKKGQSDKELTGHTTEHYINGVPKKKTEYAAYLNQIIDEDTFRILTNPLYFNINLNWKDRRNIVMDLENDIGPVEIFKENRDLKPLERLLEDKTIDNLKAEMASRRKKLNEELKSIPYRIDELSREDLEVDVEVLNSEKKSIEKELTEIKNSSSVDYEFRLRGIKGSITTLENEIENLERNAATEIMANLDLANKAKYNLEKSVRESDSKALELSSHARGLIELIEKTEKEIEELKEMFLDIKVTEFKEESTICPTCQQKLKSEKVEALIKEFEENKRARLRDINEIGKQKQDRLAQAIEELNQTEIKLEGEKEGLEVVKEMLEVKKKEVAGYEEDIENIDITKLPEYKENKSKIEDLKKEKLKLEEKSKDDDYTERIKELETQILTINKDLAKVDLAVDNKKRVDQLMQRERELAQMVADSEGIEFLCDKYVITKSNLLESKLNSKFSLVKFKLFDVQVNGGISETFVTTVDGVPFEDLNNAMKINAGLDIIKTLSEHYSLKLPIFVDNAESINQLLEVSNQVIRLIVSKDKKLKMEVEG